MRSPQRSSYYYRHYCYCPYYPYHYYHDYDYDYEYEDDYYDYEYEDDYYDWEQYEPYLDMAAQKAFRQGMKQGMARARAMLAKKAEATKEPEKGTE